MTADEHPLGGATTATTGTPFPVDISRDRRLRRAWGPFLAGPVLWFGHFMFVYLVAEAGCTGDGPGLELFDPPVPRTVTLVVTALAAAACVPLAGWALRRWRTVSRAPAPDTDVLAGRNRDRDGRGTLDFAGFLLSAFSLVAILFVGLPAAFPPGMLNAVLAHGGTPVAPHDIWRAWNLDPLLLGGLLGAIWLYNRGHGRGRRATYFLAGVAAMGVALISPLDAMSGALASAHMVQHLLLALVAAPLLAMSAPAVQLLRGSPRVARRAVGRSRRWLQRKGVACWLVRDPVAVALLHVAALWTWHAAVPYDAALRSRPLHLVEHASFLVTAFLFWRVVVGARRSVCVSKGLGAVLVFAMGMQSVILSLLLTFARTPWYAGYSTTTTAWGLEPLADQQLAGVIMWVPAGLVYVGVALGLFIAWLNGTDAVSVPARSSPAPIPDKAGRTAAG